MIERISGFRQVVPPSRGDLRTRLLKDSLHENSRVLFRYREARKRGRVLELLPRAALIEFHDSNAAKTRVVSYSSILRVLAS